MIGIVFIVFVVTLLMGIPIFFVLGLSSLVYFLIKGLSPVMVIQRMFVGMDQFIIMAVPLFILAGNLMNNGGTLKRLINFAKILVGHWRGGLAHVNVITSMLFAGITGAATADVAALGPLEIKMMTENGYDLKFSTALTISSACIGPIIPPSLPLVVYGVVAGVSIGTLFLAGFIPGILLGLGLIFYIIIYAKRKNLPIGNRPSLGIVWKGFINALGPLGLPSIIILGIYTGIFTPTEAAAVACLYAIILGKFVYKELKWKDFPGILYETVITTANALSIVAIASAFSWIIAVENIPEVLASFLLTITNNKYLLLVLIDVALLILGCFMETLAAIIITAPIFLPILSGLGVDPVHFGIIISINLTLGLITPPVGINLFIASTITKLSVEKISKAVIPMLAICIIVLLIVTLIPDISTFLPRLLLRGY